MEFLGGGGPAAFKSRELYCSFDIHVVTRVAKIKLLVRERGGNWVLLVCKIRRGKFFASSVSIKPEVS